jgi:hypothetical protein
MTKGNRLLLKTLAIAVAVAAAALALHFGIRGLIAMHSG